MNTFCKNCAGLFTEEELVEIDGELYCSDCVDELFVQCRECEAYVSKAEHPTEYGGNYYCYDCWKDLFTECRECGCTFRSEEAEENSDGEWVCPDCLERYYNKCYNCGNYEREETLNVVNGNAYCENCLDDLFVQCRECDEYIDIDYATNYDDEYYCDSCISRYFTRCRCCGDLLYIDHAHSTIDGYVCDYCRDSCYFQCDGCDELVHNDHYGEDGLCIDCSENSRNGIHSYDYKPDFGYFPEYFLDTLYLGWELEVDGGGEDEYNAGILIDILESGYAYAKHDGSLRNGFEIVSHPATLEFHLSQNLKSLMSRALSMGYRSHDSGTCGLHVHVNRSYLGSTVSERDNNILKILYINELLWDQFKNFSRRTESQLQNWACRYGLMPPDELLNTAKHSARYHAINLQNNDTIEFRMWRGTLRPQTFKATLQLVVNLVNIAKEIDVTALQNLSWEDFLYKCNPEHKDMWKYLEKRKLLPESLGQNPVEESDDGVELESTGQHVINGCNCALCRDLYREENV